MVKRLDGKICIITGAGTGIGEAIAHKFAKEGATVVINGLPGDPVEEVAAAIRKHGATAVTYAGDISEERHAQALVELAVEKFGRLDILINNAGTFPVTAETQEYPIEVFDILVRANVRSVFLMTRFALPHLQKSRGNVVSAGSESGFIGLANNTPYGGTKAWTHSFMRGVAVEQASTGRARSVPRTDRHGLDPQGNRAHRQEDGEDADPSDAHGPARYSRRGGQRHAFLASDEASYVTGALWVVDGGTTIAKGPVGDETPRELREAPKGELHDLEHAHEGLEVTPTAR